MKLIVTAYKYLKRYPTLSAAVLCSIIIASLFEGASFGMLIPLIQSMVQEGAKTILLIFISLFALLLMKNVFIYVSSLLIAKLRFEIIKDLRIKLMDNLLGYDAKYFDGAKTGHMIANMTTETERIGNFIKSVLQSVALSGRVAAYGVLLFLISWKVSIAIFLLIAVVLIPIELIMTKLRRIGTLVSKSIAQYNFKLTEILGGMRLIRTRGTEDLEKEGFDAACSNTSRFQYKSNKYINLIVPLSEVGIFGAIVLCLFILISVTEINFADAFPFIATYFLVLARALTQLNNINSRRSDAMSFLAAFGNYEALNDPKDKKTIKSGDRLVERFSDSINFDNVSFSYVKGKAVLSNINFRIPNGKITALVGASGAGKSTIVNLILRFYDADSGKILVDGVSLKDLSLRAWRRNIGFVSQDIFIFNANVKNNIAYGCVDSSAESVTKAAKAAHAHEFIMNLPEGYDTELGERGVKLSGGQKQRISIARSIMYNPEILILDEATSSLDTATEKLITEAISTLTTGRTVVAIAHRLSTILHADNIIVLDKGRLIESGNHKDLLEKKGLYKKLFDMQFSV